MEKEKRGREGAGGVGIGVELDGCDATKEQGEGPGIDVLGLSFQSHQIDPHTRFMYAPKKLAYPVSVVTALN